jgi:glutathione synthase/RimK-type ligase-like ATP-grasp enzyme
LNSKRKSTHVGVMVCDIPQTKGSLPFAYSGFMRRLSLTGHHLGICVYIFSTEWIDWVRRELHGYTYASHSSGWQRRKFPLPDLIYDRAFFHNRTKYNRHRVHVARLLKLGGTRWLGLGLRGKWYVHRILAVAPAVAQFLPKTERYQDPASLSAWFTDAKDVIVKPQGGTHGKGVFRLRRISNERYEAVGRNQANATIRRQFRNLQQLLHWTHRHVIHGRMYLIQQYLPLTTRDGAPFDIRALVQKNGKGTWDITGTAVRIGPIAGITSNLHGGGRAKVTLPFLTQKYGATQAQKIVQTIHSASLDVAQTLEKGHGPLVELGLDFGVDPQGRVWLLEANSRPGRTSFMRLYDALTVNRAVTNPIRYARYVLNRN